MGRQSGNVLMAPHSRAGKTLNTAQTKTLNEFVVAVHFQTPLNLNVLDLASWASAFSEYPKVQQLEAGPRVELAPAPGFQFELATESTPRLMLSGENGRNVQLQTDRFAHGWVRRTPVGEPADYPGFIEMINGFRVTFDRFAEWYAKRLGVPASPARLVELGYLNMVPMERDGIRHRLGDVFKLVTPGLRKVNAFTTAWVEGLTTDVDSPRVTAQVGLAKAPPNLNVLAFNFTGLANVKGNDQMIKMIEALHDRISDMYRSTMNADL